MLLTIYNIYTKKADIIKKTVEDEKDFFTNRIYGLENGFYLSFFEQSVESTVADAYEFFVELDCGNNIFYENLNMMNEERGRRLYKIMAMYHTIKIMRKKRNEIDCEEMKKALFDVFNMDIEERKVFSLLYQCACEFEAKFHMVFAQTFVKYLFGKDKCSIFSLAFIENYCFNSHEKFMESFTRYMSVNRRLKNA